MRILVVCGGNRSIGPMLGAILRNRLGRGMAQANSRPHPGQDGVAKHALEDIQVEDAGLFAFGEGAEDDAIQVMSAHYGVDLQDHTPTQLTHAQLTRADFILTTDPYIQRRLQESYPVDAHKLIPLAIEDPYLHGRMAYEKAVESIEEQLQAIMPRLTGQAGGDFLPAS